jgi:hypothetical protein
VCMKMETIHAAFALRSHRYCGQAVNTNFVCIFALVVLHVKPMDRVELSFVARLTLPYFSTSRKRGDFRKKILPGIKCFFSLSLCNFWPKHISFEQEFREMLS